MQIKIFLNFQTHKKKDACKKTTEKVEYLSITGACKVDDAKAVLF